MRKLLIVLLLFIFQFPFFLSGQHMFLDSFQQDLKSHPERDADRVQILGAIGRSVQDTSLMEKYMAEAIEIARELNEPNLEARIMRLKALEYAKFNNPQKGLRILQQIKEIANTDKDCKIQTATNEARILIAYLGKIKEAKIVLDEAQKVNATLPKDEQNERLYNALGIVNMNSGDFSEAEKNYLEVVRLGRIKELDISPTLANLGNLSYQEGLLDKALEYYLQSLKEDRGKNPGSKTLAYNNISNLYAKLKNNAKALEYGQKSLDLARTEKDDKLILKAENILGNIHIQNGELEKAKVNYMRAYTIAKKSDNAINLTDAAMGLSTYYHEKEQVDSTIFYGKKALQSLKENGEASQKIRLHKIMGKAYTMSGDFPKAEYHLNQSLTFLETFKSIKSKNQVEEALYQLYKKQKKPAKALFHFENFFATHDSLSNENRTEQIAEMQTKYETEKKEAENKTLLASNQFIAKQNQQYKIGAGILTGLLALLAYFFFQLRKTRNQLAAQNQQLTDLNATKDKFFGIIAHDIRSPITALDGVSEQMNYYLEKDDKSKLNRLADRIDTTAKRLTSLLDNLLNWALLQTGMIPYNPKSVDIQTVTQENIDLFQPVAEAKNITLQNNISTASPVFSDESALNTIIRNLINNAIKFTPTGGEVSINTEEKGNKVFIKINDTGTGIAADKLEKLFSLEKQSSKGTAGEKGSGLGLMLCKELVELNKGTIQAISELGKGSSFVFSLPKV